MIFCDFLKNFPENLLYVDILLIKGIEIFSEVCYNIVVLRVGQPTLKCYMYILEEVLSKIKQIAEELALPVEQDLGLSLYDVEYKKDGTDWRLTFFIDKENGVTLTDCEDFSRRISDVLDSSDPIEQNYILTV